MEFLRARTQEQITNRQEEIIRACERLFEESGYDGVNFKAVSELTTFTRPTIYTYYKTKDEALLDLLEGKLFRYQEDLKSWMKREQSLTRDEYSRQLTELLMKHEMMLKLWSILFTLLEHNCRVERLAEFKKQIIQVLGTVHETVTKFFPEAKEQDKGIFVSALMSFLLGLYPMSHMTEKQNEAIRMAGIMYEAPDFYGTCYEGIRLLAARL